jgi:hypothetical protein
MDMPEIDIPLKADVRALLNIPECEFLRLPLPSPTKVQLPTGATLKAFTDISKGIPTDCAMSFNLLVQLAPLLASMECLIKILKLIKPLIDVVGSLGPPPDPIKLPKAITDFTKAAADLAPCLLIPTPANMIPFIRDLLCLILKMLKCFRDELKTILGVMTGLTLQLNLAEAAGNIELQNSLKCAKENAELSAKHLTTAIEPLGVILDLIGPFLGIAGVQPIKLPQIGSDTDLASLNAAVEALQSVVSVLQTATDALGGCGT